MIYDEVRIEMTGPGEGKVWLDGVQMKGVVSVKFESRLHECNRVTLELLVKGGSVKNSGEIDVSNMESTAVEHLAGG